MFHPLGHSVGEDGLDVFVGAVELPLALPAENTVQERVRDRVKALYDSLAAVIRDGVASGDFAPIDADELATFLISSWCGVLIAADSPLTPPANTENARRTIDQATSILMRGLRRPVQP